MLIYFELMQTILNVPFQNPLKLAAKIQMSISSLVPNIWYFVPMPWTMIVHGNTLMQFERTY